MRLAKAAYEIEGQPMFKVLQKVQERGGDVVHFEIGDPDFDTPMPITHAAIGSLLQGETHYTSSMGLPDFIEAVRWATARSRGFMPAAKQILPSPGANMLIYYAVRVLCDPGDEVIIPDPGFPTYHSVLKFCGVTPIRVPLKESRGFRMDPQDVWRAITPKTRLVIVNSPQNPTGAVMHRDDLEIIAGIIKDSNVFLYSDEIYARMVYDGEFHSPATEERCARNLIVANGFSKAFAMTGWRLGVAIGPEDVIEKMGLLLQTTHSCVSPFIQRAGITALDTKTEAMMYEYQLRRELLVDGLNELPGVSCVKPGGAFYAFPNITGTGMDSESFTALMLEHGVALLPGTCFGEQGEGHVRLCYATSRDRIQEGLARMREALCG